MRYALIRKEDISNGDGIRVSLFVQGCSFHCKGCFNEATWDFLGGKEFTDETINTILELCSKDYIAGLSILGGEPMHPSNRDEVFRLCKIFKQHFPHKTIWMWSGYTYEDKDFPLDDVANSVDVLVDGRFILEKRNLKLRFRGSDNQRIIHFKNGKIDYIEK